MISVLRWFVDQARDIDNARKIESLGLFAGGIAHDFNNILAGILGNTSLLLSEIKNNAANCGAQELVTACPLCAYNLTANGAAGSLPTRYFTELLAEALGVAESEGGAE